MEFDLFSYFSPMHCACETGNIDIVKLLLDYRADPNLIMQQRRKLPTERLGVYWSPFHIACECGNIELVKFLVDNRADINLPNSHGVSPLHIVSQHPMPELITFLLDNGANPNAKDKDRETPLVLAARARLSVNVELLITEANIDEKNIHDDTPLHVASSLGFSEIVDILIRNNAKVDIPNKDGNTPLHLAVISKHKECVSFLLDAHADVFVLNNKRQSSFVLSSGEITTMMKKVIEKAGRENKNLRVKTADKTPRSTKKTPSQINNQREKARLAQTRTQKTKADRVPDDAQSISQKSRSDATSVAAKPLKRPIFDENDMYSYMDTINFILEEAQMNFNRELLVVQQEMDNLHRDLEKYGAIEENA
ncbi:hypothetical protein TRFO_37124 [Tritrichomonas foetus]|uniref:Uncharacterized protein n=1 Tax=Tritrichomonas foetus TaxID=1144522 RepID=A0A1J4JEJ2_9EUKA|nr:hypothetical protein TRFO_37124 [Tritrichomonas foetus]|eukprot:OHS96711.1 hypothetical protein TRFO_37124 [Tritrichomonas foetus]